MDEWFTERVDELKRDRTIVETRFHDVRKMGNPPASAIFVAAHLDALYRSMIEVYEILKEIATKVDEYESEFQQRKPTWDYMEKAMEHTKETLKKGK